MKMIFACILLFIAACQNNVQVQKKQGHESIPENEALQPLRLNPATGSVYHYDIVNESRIKMEAGERNIDNRNITTVSVSYEIDKDSAGNFVLHMKYDKIQLHLKNGDTETDMDAANAAYTSDPIEKMLGILKNAQLSTTISPSGEILSMSGYQQLTDQIMAKLDAPDLNSRKMAQTRWQQLVEEGIIKKNIEQFFRIFPDSVVTPGDSWTIDSHQKTELPLQVHTKYTLESIDNDIAMLISKGEMTSEKGKSDVMGYEVSSNLSGQQKGKFEIEMHSGMLVKCSIDADIEGNLQIMGRDVPVKIITKVKMSGKKLK